MQRPVPIASTSAPALRVSQASDVRSRDSLSTVQTLIFSASAFCTRSVTPVPSENGFLGDSFTGRRGGGMAFFGDVDGLAMRWVTRVEKN